MYKNKAKRKFQETFLLKENESHCIMIELKPKNTVFSKEVQNTLVVIEIQISELDLTGENKLAYAITCCLFGWFSN